MSRPGTLDVSPMSFGDSDEDDDFDRAFCAMVDRELERDKRQKSRASYPTTERSP